MNALDRILVAVTFIMTAIMTHGYGKNYTKNRSAAVHVIPFFLPQKTWEADTLSHMWWSNLASNLSNRRRLLDVPL